MIRMIATIILFGLLLLGAIILANDLFEADRRKREKKNNKKGR